MDVGVDGRRRISLSTTPALEFPEQWQCTSISFSSLQMLVLSSYLLLYRLALHASERDHSSFLSPSVVHSAFSQP